MHWLGWNLNDDTGDVLASVWANAQGTYPFLAYVKVGERWEKSGYDTLAEAMAAAEARVAQISEGVPA